MSGLAFDQELSHGDEAEYIGLEHGFHIVWIDVSNMSAKRLDD